MEVKLESRVLDVTQRRRRQVGDVKEEEKWQGTKLSHRLLLPDKQTSKWNFVLAAPFPPLLHTSCDSPNHNPWAIREVPVHVSPGAGPLSQGNQCSQ